GAIKSYVDAAAHSSAQGLAVKTDVVAATTENITIATALNDGNTLDGVTLADDDRVLVKNQTSAEENGIYVVAASPVRADDMNADGEFANAFVFVTGGSDNADTGWACTVDEATITVGTTAITFAQFNSAGTITAGSGLSKSGNTIKVIDAAKGSVLVANTLNTWTALSGVTDGHVLTYNSSADTVGWAEAAGVGSVDAANGADNRVATFTDADSLNGEANLTFDGTTLAVAGALSNTTGATLASDSGVTTMGSTTGATVSALGILNVNNTTDATSKTDGSLQTDGGLSVAKAIYNGTAATLAADSGVTTIGSTTAATISAAGVLTVNNETDASSSTTGSTIIDGGMGIAKKLYVGTDLDVTGTSNLENITAASDARTLATGQDKGGFVFTPGAATEHGSGATTLASGMTVDTFAVENAGGSATTAALLHLDGVPTGSATNNYSLWCGSTDGTTADGRIGGAIISGGTY
ncbi:MAG: hypothetical protein QF535_12905, partial [Anaerolineales bacterium]|nr:hypothetical protein [Anaerolineales bacterium]